MRVKNSGTRYSSYVIGLHWWMLLLAAVYACRELRDFLPKGSALRANLKTRHLPCP